MFPVPTNLLIDVKYKEIEKYMEHISLHQPFLGIQAIYQSDLMLPHIHLD